MDSSSIWNLSHSAGAFYDLAIHREGGCALNSDRTVSCWGYGVFGQHGDGTTGSYDGGNRTANITNVVDLAAGQEHLCAVVDNGTAWCWGRDHQDQLGDNTTNSNNRSSLPIALAGGISNFIQIESYAQTTCTLTDNGTVWCWGNNTNGQLGDGTTTNSDYPVQVQNITDALDIYVGPGSACAAVNKRLDLKCWGDYFLGDGSSSESSTPVTVAETNGWGSTYTFDDVAIGQASVCVYNLANNQVFCWGRNSEGQLGDGTTTTTKTMNRASTPF
jgi:alpha-tubulin suppressor-like RCC1 family protein